MIDAFQVFARDVDPVWKLCARRDVYGVMLVPELVERHIGAHLCIEVYLHADLLYQPDLVLQYIRRQPVFRYAEREDAAGHWLRLVHFDIVAQPCQVVSAGKA